MTKVVSTKPFELSEETVLSKPIIQVDTWPFSPYYKLKNPQRLGKPAEPIEKIQDWYRPQFQDLSRMKEGLSEKRLLGVSWLLAVSIGVVTNLLAIAITGQLSVPSTGRGIGMTILLADGVFALGILYFVYFPASLEYPITALIFPQSFIGNTPEIDQGQIDGVVGTTYSIEFKNIMQDWAKIVTLCTLRDAIKKTKLKTLRVIALEDADPLFVLLLDIRREREFFFDFSLVKKARVEIQTLLQNLLTNHVGLSNYDFENDPQKWMSDGHKFLNEFCKWQREEVIETIKSECRE